MTSPGGDAAGGGVDGKGTGFLRLKLRNAFHSSSDIISGISSNISSRLSMFSTASSSSLNQESATPPPGQDDDSESEPALQLHMLPGTPEPMSPPSERKSPITMTEKIKAFKLEDLRPAMEDLMLSNNSSEPSTLPTNTPEESPRSGFRFKFSSINQSLPKRFEDYKALAIRTLSGDAAEVACDKSPNLCAIKVDYAAPVANGTKLIAEESSLRKSDSHDLDNASTCLSSRSFPSLHSLQATGPDPYDKFKYKHDLASSGSASETGVGHSTSLDSTDSDPHKKLWIRSGSQASLQSWASSLSYDSQAEEVNEVRDFMKTFVEDVFKNTLSITVDRKAEFGRLAQTELGRLWFARCINAKRCCKCVSESTFFSLIQHFAVVLFECAEADDFSPAKSLMNMCFTYYHEVTSPGGRMHRKEFVYLYLRQQTIWKSLRFWNAAFFDALQCERFMRPVVTRDQVEANRLQAVTDELRYQENITFGQLGTFTCNMHALGLPKETVNEFLRKQVTIASLRPDQVKLLRENVDRMYSDKQEWN